MVKWLLALFAFAGDVDVKVEVDRANEYYPVKASVIVTHSKEESVEGFTYQGKELPVQLQREVQIPPLVLSIYQFELPPQTVGEQKIEGVKVKVGETYYESNPVFYRVVKGQAPQNTEEPLLQLEVKVESEEPLYPGQRAKLIYRYIYRGDIEMTKETLPLLKATDFKIIGEERVQDFQEADKNVRQITLEVEALKPGTYTFDKSIIEGQAVRPGKPPLALHAEADSVTITVTPLPEGATTQVVGTFTIKTELLTSPKLKVGDQLTLAVTIEGGDVEFPDLFCQPGFPGFFQQDEVPVGKVEGNLKRFILHLRPTNEGVKEIPSIILSYYNPAAGAYEKSVSQAIPLQVESIQHVAAGRKSLLSEVQKGGDAKEFNAALAKLPPLQVSEVRLVASSDLATVPFGGWSVLMIVPAGVLVLAGQRWLSSRKRMVREPSLKELLEEARRVKNDPAQFYPLIDRILAAKQDTQLKNEIEKGRFGHSMPLETDKILYRVGRLL